MEKNGMPFAAATTDSNSTIFSIQLHPICLIPPHQSSHVSLICHNILTNFVHPGDIETNPSPITGSLHHAIKSSTKKFLLFSVNIRSLLNPKNSITLSDLASCSRLPDLIALQET